MIKKLTLKSPEEFLEILKNYFNKDRKFIFILTFVLGLITHFLLISNLIFSQDGLLNGIHYTAGGYEASLGRWGINFFDSIRNNVTMPFITTLISILLMGLINILLIEIFEIKNKIFKVLTILAVVASPSLCMTLLYTYTADVYLFAMFFSVFTVYALYKMKNKKLGVFLAIISFIVMLSTYQSYMGITIGLVLMVNIKKILKNEITAVEAIKDIVIKAVIILISAVLYFIITKIYLKANGLTMSSYKGTDQISLATILGSLIPSIKTAYTAFLKYFFADGIVLNRAWRRQKLYLVFFVLLVFEIAILFVKLLKNEKKNKELFFKLGLSTILMVVLPIALNIVIIIAPGNEIYYLIATQMLLMIPFAFMIFELLSEKNIITDVLNWVLVIVVSIIMGTYFFSVAVTYETAELSYIQAQSIGNRIVDRMEECPGYRAGMNKLFAGVIDDVNFAKHLDLYDLAVTNSLRSSIFHGTYWGQESTWRNFMDLFCGTHITFCDDYEYYTIINSDEFKEMDIFPGENSVKIINDVMVVKFTETPSNPPPSQLLADHGINIE